MGICNHRFVPSVRNTIRPLSAFILAICGCAPALRSTVFQSLPPQPVDHPIAIFQTKLPDCPYDEVGIVSSRQRNKFISMASALAALKTRAREMGGDAILGLGERNEVQGFVGSTGVMDRDPVLSGTVIRFRERDCALTVPGSASFPMPNCRMQPTAGSIGREEVPVRAGARRG